MGCAAECFTNEDCQNGVYCDGRESCVAGRCFDRPNPDCSDGVACTVDTCEEATRSCINTPDDGMCTGTDTCALGAGCIPQCTMDSDCDDGLFCNGAEQCSAGSCTLGRPPTDDGIACTFALCDEALDMIGPQVPDDSFCDDAMACNGAERCSPSLGCLPETRPAFGGSCTHSFTDISGTGMNYGSCDDCVFSVSLGGEGARMYGVTATTVAVDSNGSIRLDPSATTSYFFNECLPSGLLGSSLPAIAPLWKDLTLANNPPVSALFHEYFSTCPRTHPTYTAAGCNIIQWNDAEEWPGSATFDVQAIIYDGIEEVVFVYNDDTLDGGLNSVIGVQSSGTGSALSTCYTAGSALGNSSTCVTAVPLSCTPPT